jgi:signal transduction histidine kinase
MRRTLLAFFLCVGLPALALAYLGLRGGGGFEAREMDRLRALARTRITETTRTVAEKAAERIRAADAFLDSWDAALLPDNGRPIFFLTAEGDIAARPQPAPVTGEEQRLLMRCLRGGEHEEFARKDLLGAAGAYTFFLSSLTAPPARATVIYRAGRSLERLGDRSLAAHLYREVTDAYPGTVGPEGEPLDALALFGLWRLGHTEREAILIRLRQLRHSLGRSWATGFARELGLPPHPAPDLPEPVRTELGERGRVPEQFVRAGRLYHFKPAAPGLLVGTSIDSTEFARDPGAGARPDVRTAFLPLREAAIAAGSAGAPGPRHAPDTVAWGLVTTERGIPLGYAVATSPRLAEIRGEARRRRRWFQGVVALLVLLTAAGAVLVTRTLRTQLRLLTMKSEFIANVSHEMKTPVSAVRMFAEMLAEDSLDPPKARRFARVLLAESERLSAIVENILDFNRLERGEMALPIEPLDLESLLRRQAEGFALRAEREGVRFHAEINGIGSVPTNGNAVARILQNLLDNAVKYRREGDPEVMLLAREDGDRVRIEVRDNGMGIPRNEQEKIFEKFYRIKPKDRTVRGTGMGLALARALAGRLHGSIEVASTPRTGSTFTLVLPRADREGGRS